MKRISSEALAASETLTGASGWCRFHYCRSGAARHNNRISPTREPPMYADLDTPQLLLDLDVLDANLARMRQLFADRDLDLRVHFKSLKTGGLARYLAGKGVTRFLAAKVN